MIALKSLFSEDLFLSFLEIMVYVLLFNHEFQRLDKSKYFAFEDGREFHSISVAL